jgi:hypothetical protein
MDLLLTTGYMGSINASYMDATKNTPFLASCQRDSSDPYNNWMEANCCSSLFQEVNQSLIRSLLKVVDCGDISSDHHLQGITFMMYNIV